MRSCTYVPYYTHDAPQLCCAVFSAIVKAIGCFLPLVLYKIKCVFNLQMRVRQKNTRHVPRFYCRRAAMEIICEWQKVSPDGGGGSGLGHLNATVTTCLVGYNIHIDSQPQI